MVLNDLRNTPPQNTSVSSTSLTPYANNQVNSIHLSKQTATPTSTSTSTSTPSTTSTVTPPTTSTPTTSSPPTTLTTPTQSSAPQPSTTSSSSSTPSVYDTNDNNIYNFPLLHGGNGNMGQGVSNFFKNFNLTPGVLIIFLVVVVVFVLLFSSLSSLGKNGSSDTSSATTSIDSGESTGSSGGNKSQIIKIIIIVLIVIAISFLYRKFEGTSIIASIKKLFTKNPQVNVTAGKTSVAPMNQPANANATGKIPEIKLYKEVFNIPGNNYTYPQAQSICSAYDAKLATYDELEESYNIGAEWCNYGWSEGQMALFPTQKKTYNTLQTIKGHEHDCGRPGINGGYMANPNVRYGVNCYGHKPKRTEIEKELMENTAPYPLTKEDMLMEKQVDYWKTQLSNIIVSPFNTNRWSKF